MDGWLVRSPFVGDRGGGEERKTRKNRSRGDISIYLSVTLPTDSSDNLTSLDPVHECNAFRLHTHIIRNQDCTKFCLEQSFSPINPGRGRGRHNTTIFLGEIPNEKTSLAPPS